MTRTRPPGSKAQHGSSACGEYGCGRPECVAAARRVWKQRNVDRSRGTRRQVPAGPLREHIEVLVAAGMSVRTISAQSGVAESTIRTHRRGSKSGLTYADTAAAILAIPIPDAYVTPLHEWVSAVGTTRRLGALSARGFPSTVIARELRLPKQTVIRIRAGVPNRIVASTCFAVAGLYGRWWQADPLEHGASAVSAAVAAARAAVNGWAPPAAWDDERIDDPAGYPDWTGACGTARGRTLHLTLPGIPNSCPACDAAPGRRAA